MEADIYTLKGEKKGKIKLSKDIFDRKLNENFLNQVLNSQKSNERKVIAHTKDRGEVRGGGKKPWRQKGTGRARAGSNRSPLWKGGGVTFGPTNKRNFKKRIPRSFKQQALLMVLSKKFHDKKIIILDDLKIDKAKTKILFNILKKLSLDNKSCLIALPDRDINIMRSIRNIPKKKVEELRNLNALDVMSYQYLVITQKGIKLLEDKFSK